MKIGTESAAPPETASDAVAPNKLLLTRRLISGGFDRIGTAVGVLSARLDQIAVSLKSLSQKIATHSPAPQSAPAQTLEAVDAPAS